MKVNRSQVEKIRIEDIGQSHNLDPINCIIENYGEGRGKITIDCYGDVWTGFWGSMGGTVEEFFQRASNDYLINKMSDYRSSVADPDRDPDYLKSLIVKHRGRGDIDKEEAREAFDYVENNRPDRNSLMYGYTPKSFEAIEWLREPFYLDWPETKNPKYEYLSRIIDVVREVIKPVK